MEVNGAISEVFKSKNVKIIHFNKSSYINFSVKPCINNFYCCYMVFRCYFVMVKML